MINESIGPSGTAEILKMVAERLKVICPESGRLYRNGNDEFIILLEANCQKAQGYLYSKAVPLGEIEDKYFLKVNYIGADFGWDCKD